jgi:hypothetical protein
MATIEFDLLCAFETHAVDTIREILDGGLDARSTVKGKTLTSNLIEMYRGRTRFPPVCVCCSNAAPRSTIRESRRCCSTTSMPWRRRCAAIRR